MGKPEITKGIARADGNKIMVGKVEVLKIHAEERGIQYTPSNWEARKNSALIVETFNVTNETGLTPREILKDRDRLLQLLKEINTTTDEYIKTSEHGK